MLRVGLTGGIGAGKSTVARRLVELGATLVDADLVAREVVLPGSVGLARLVEQFGAGVLDADGGLDRPGLGEIVFGDPEARQRLNGILHPLIGRRTAELIAEAPHDSVIVQDVPLLVEGAMAASFPLVIVVHAPESERVRRLIEDRGMTEAAARARIAAQADDDARRAAADVWLNNSGSADAVRSEVDRLWTDRLCPFDTALRAGAPPSPSPERLEPVVSDPTWPEQYDRLAARIARAVGDAALQVDHIGLTAVPGLAAPDVLEVQVGVRSTDEVAGFAPDLAAVGFLRPGTECDVVGTEFISADPGRPARVYVREAGSTAYREALLLRDWMRDLPDHTALTGEIERAALGDRAEYAGAAHGWWRSVLDSAERWAASTGWHEPGPEASG